MTKYNILYNYRGTITSYTDKPVSLAKAKLLLIEAKAKLDQRQDVRCIYMSEWIPA
jgi:hypothetical protein